MGTDIDLYVEKKNPDGKWEIMFPDPELMQVLHPGPAEQRPYGPGNLPGWAWYSGRNYDLFGLLADVRNRSDIESPWAHRGIPKDSGIHEFLGDGDSPHYHGHSHSWVSLQELLDYDWGTPVHESGYMGALAYRYWMDHDKKKWLGYSGFVGGPDVVHVSNKEMDALFEKGTLVEKPDPVDGEPDRTTWVSTDGKSYYTQCEWDEPMEHACRYFVNNTLTVLKKMAKDEGIDPADIRLLYWFDC